MQTRTYTGVNIETNTLKSALEYSYENASNRVSAVRTVSELGTNTLGVTYGDLQQAKSKDRGRFPVLTKEDKEPSPVFMSTAERTFTNILGNQTRIVDSYNISKQVIGEAKYGYQGLSKFIQSEIVRDSYLLNNNIVKAVEWHFYYSGVSNTFGPSGPLYEALENAGFKIVLH